MRKILLGMVLDRLVSELQRVRLSPSLCLVVCLQNLFKHFKDAMTMKFDDVQDPQNKRSDGALRGAHVSCTARKVLLSGTCQQK